MHSGKDLQSTNHNKASRALMCDNMSVDVLLCQITSSKWEGFLFSKKKSIVQKLFFFVRGSPLSGRPTNLGYSRARAYCVYNSRG